MILVRWSPAAVADLTEIAEYLENNQPALAASTVLKLYETVQSLRRMPHRGRVGREHGTRELILPSIPYVIVYRVLEDAVSVVRLLHTARNWPST